MSRESYHEIFIHVVWHTKASMRFIHPTMEADLYRSIEHRARGADGIYVHQVGGTDNHIHLVCRVRPTLLLSDWIGQIKGGSAHDINEMPRWHKSLQWQSGYGIVTFGAKDLAWVVDYVRNQKQHHASGRVFERLETSVVEQGSSQQREAR